MEALDLVTLTKRKDLKLAGSCFLILKPTQKCLNTLQRGAKSLGEPLSKHVKSIIKSHLIIKDEGSQMLETLLYYVAVLIELQDLSWV